MVEEKTNSDRGRSKLLRKKLPTFEAPRDYASYAARTPEDEAAEIDANEVFEAAAKEEIALRSKQNRTDAETLDAILSCIGAQSSLREVLFKTLNYCKEERAFEDVERYISEADETVYSHIIQPPFALIQMLEHCGGLLEKGFDAEGNELDPELMENISEDEFIELFDHATLVTTEAGRKAIELITPEKRFNSLIAQRPHRADTFYQLMEFCREPRKFPEIQQWFKDTPGLALDQVQVHHTLAPDFYVDKLDKAGVLVWRGSWVLTPVGEQLLAQRPCPEK